MKVMEGLSNREIGTFARLTDPFTESGRIASEERRVNEETPREVLDRYIQSALEDQYEGTVDEIPPSTREWLANRGSPLLDHPDMPPGEDDYRY